jgi:sensor histidine kinase YesM
MKCLFKLLFILLHISFIQMGHAQPLNITEMRIISPSPSNCNSIDLDDSKWPSIYLSELPKNTKFCLRTQIHIEEDTLSGSSLYLSMLASSRIYWDGYLIYENGAVAETLLLEEPGEIDVIVQIPNRLLNEGIHYIAIEGSNFHLGNNIESDFYNLAILETQQVYDYVVSNAILSAFILGCLFIFSILFQLLFLLYQKQPTYQIFSLLCLSSACLLLTEKWRVMFGLSYDFQSLRLQLVMLFTFINGLLLPAFYLVYNQSSNKKQWITLVFSVLVASLLLVHDYDDKSIAMYFSSLLITFCINLMALKNGTKGIWLNTVIILFGIVVFIVEPTRFTEDRFALTLFAIITVMLISLIKEMKNNRLRSLASIRLEAELLKRNLQPHFLMNSLMLIIEWIEEKPNAAAEFVQALGEELRMLVKFSGLSLVPLQEEISLCRRHIEIMSYRYDTKYTFDVSGIDNSILIPPAVIHTQIENAFSHNLLPNNANFTLEVIQQKNRIKLILVSPFNSSINSQSAYNNHEKEGPGIGERYIRSRLEECFHNNFSYQSYCEGATWINIIEFKVEN